MNRQLGKGLCIVLALILIFSLGACKKQPSSSSETSVISGIPGTTDPSSSGTPAASGSVSSGTSSGPAETIVDDKHYTTSVEAVQMAYKEAVKWNANAVVWYVSPTATFVHYDWNNTDKAISWTIGFANPSNAEEILVYISNGKVKTLGDEKLTFYNVGNKRKVEYKAEFPKDTLKVSMKAAVKTAIANGAPAGIMPENIVYDVESFGKPGKPLWLIVYKFPDPSAAKKAETWFYYIDGVTGKLVDDGYQIERNSVSKNKLTIKGPDFSASTALSDQRRTIVKFLTLVNEGRNRDAMAMMSTTLVPDESARQKWIDTMHSIQGMEIEDVLESNKSSWTDQLQRYNIEIIVSAGADLLKYGWKEGLNKRLVILKRNGNIWQIDAMTTP